MVLAFNFGLRFFAVFLGCLRAGVVAVPVYPPSPATLKKSLVKLQLIVDSCKPRMILVCPEVNRLRLLGTISLGKSGWPDVPYKCPDVANEVANSSALASFSARTGKLFQPAKVNSFDELNIEPEDLAFLQFTSGSTSDPKGVMVTYGNLDHNLDLIIGITEQVSTVLPS